MTFRSASDHSVVHVRKQAYNIDYSSSSHHTSVFTHENSYSNCLIHIVMSSPLLLALRYIKTWSTTFGLRSHKTASNTKQNCHINRHTMLVLPAVVLRRGLRYLQMEYACKRKSEFEKTKIFRQHYGSSPLDLASMWHDLTVTDIPEARVDIKEQGDAGFMMFLVAHFFLWTYPKNSGLIVSRFRICEKYSRGKHLWLWLRRIAALTKLKVKWDPRLDSSETEIFVVTVDGTDFRVWERKNPRFNQDKRQCSVKFNHAAAKYEVAINVFTSNVAWINGPFRGGEHDLTMMRKGELFDKIAEGKKAIADRGYQTGVPEERAKLSLPSSYDPKELNNFKSRARLRQETFNGRLKKFNILSETFRHGFEKHKFVFDAVIVIVQYQMDNGSPLFAV